MAVLFTTTPYDASINEKSDPRSNKADDSKAKYFKWEPDLSDVNVASKLSKPGEDLWMSNHQTICCITCDIACNHSIGSSLEVFSDRETYRHV